MKIWMIIFLGFLSADGVSREIDHAIVSVYAVDMKTKEIVMDENSELSMTPASCLKIVTTAAALEILGEEFCYETSLEYDGVYKKGILKGNLYIKGGGDPCLGSERVPGAFGWKEQLAQWVDVVQKAGIKEIEGSVIGDASLWEKAGVVPSWSWEDVGNYYGAGASALSFHENAYTLILRPGSSVGDPVELIRTEPPHAAIFHNELRTAEAGSGDAACIYGSEFSLSQWVRGTVPLAEEFVIKGAMPDPSTYTANLLKQCLQTRGVTVADKESMTQGERKVLCKVQSPKVSEIVYHTNQKSVNLYAEHLLKKMGEIVKKEGSTEAGLATIRDFWQGKGMDMEGFRMVDGSGLSRKNLIQAKQLVQVLIAMQSSQSFINSLPEKEPGIRGKSGSMSFVRGYVGYVGDVAFAILINHCVSGKEMQQKIEEILGKLKEASLTKSHPAKGS